VTIRGNDVIIRADGRAEVYDLAYVRMLVPYLVGERDLPPMRLAHFRPGIKPWICLSVIEDDGSEPNLAGVAIYSGLGSHREMGLHLSRAEAWRLADMLTRAMPVQHQRTHEDGAAEERSREEQDPAA
jgi:hypothetical protein